MTRHTLNKPFRPSNPLLQPLSCLFRLILPLPLIIGLLLITNCVYALETPDWDKLVQSIIIVESNGDPLAVSPKGAIGICQITPIVLREWNNNHKGTPDENIGRLFEPRFNCEVAEWYLKRLFHYYKCPTVEHILAGYNGGITRLRKNDWDITQMPRETQNYVLNVIKLYSYKILLTDGLK